MIIESYTKSVNLKEILNNNNKYLRIYPASTSGWKRKPSQYYWHFANKSWIL